MWTFLNSAWLLPWLPALALAVVCLLLLRRREELQQWAGSVHERAQAKDRGSHEARLQHPAIDLSLCMGCGLCVKACPEDGVLGIMYGQAVVVHGARCVGHARCAEACPAGAIAVTLGDLSKRRDVPALQEDFEAVGVPGLFLAGEISGYALVRTAVTQGVAVADAVSRRLGADPRIASDSPVQGDAQSVVDLLVVGAGPAGIACSLRAKERGIPFLMVEQADQLGGTVSSYPRRKMVMTQPVDLPLHGRLPQLSYQKEQLVELWERLASENGLPVRTGVQVTDVRRNGSGVFQVATSSGPITARHVCLALGRRGTPRKLGIPGEDLPKVAYSLLDIESYQGRRILVVGGGDSAIEAAIGLAEQPGNQVTLTYRKKAFFRLKARNDAAIHRAIHEKRLECIFESEPIEILPDAVRLRVDSAAGASDILIPNDEVFIFAGGTPPFELLERAGVSFDPADRPPPAEIVQKGKSLLVGLGLALVFSILMLAWKNWHRDYYELEAAARALSPKHAWLRPSSLFGVTFGILACLLFAGNLAYLLRRSLRFGGVLPGSLAGWMGFHVFSGIFALLCILIHSGFTLRDTTGGHALIALLVVVVAGCVGRYFYAFVPRAINGAESNLDELRSQLAALSAEWDRRGRSFGVEARRKIEEMSSAARWRMNFFARIFALFVGQFRLRRLLRDLRAEAQRENVTEEDARAFLHLARASYRLSLQSMHFEDIRAILATWRYFHLWLAVLMILLAGIHIYTGFRYGSISWSRLFTFEGSVP